MIQPLEEIRIARDAMELIITLQTEERHFEWACESLQLTDGLRWRIMIVVFRDSIMFRTNIFIEAPSTVRNIVNEVERYLSTF